MSQELSTPIDEERPEVNTNGHNPVDVNMNDTVGATFLGILSLLLLIGWVCSEARVRKLLRHQEI